MDNLTSQVEQPTFQRLLAPLAGLPWTDIAGGLWGIAQKAVQHLASGGVYEVLDYESTLELLDRHGRWASFRKRKRVRYLQDDVIAYQDYAWGDGRILLNYRTSRGTPVDQYRCGYRTYILLSLREVRNRGDIDEFNIQWNIRRGFLKRDGFWGTEVGQRTRRLWTSVIFPRSRPPQEVSLEEGNRRRTHTLGRDSQQRLPDGRWLVTWEMNNPRLHEIYILRWIW